MKRAKKAVKPTTYTLTYWMKAPGGEKWEQVKTKVTGRYGPPEIVIPVSIELIAEVKNDPP